MMLFLMIAIVGLIGAIITFFFGGDADGDLEHDFDHPDADAGVGHGGPSVLSIKMLFLLMSGFGVAGFAARVGSEMTMGMSSLIGAGGALVLSFFGYLIMLFFYKQQSSSTLTARDAVGATGRALDRITRNDPGQIGCVIRGQQTTFIARSSSGETIPKGSQIRIVEKVGTAVYVEQVK